MQNLRDKLLNAGLVNKKQARKAEHQQRMKRRRKKKKKNQGDAVEDEAQLSREELYQAQLEEQRQRNLEFAQKERQEREAKERQLRVRYLVDHYAVHYRRGRDKWYFVTRSGKILHVMVDQRTAYGLEHGQFAIVERPREQDEDKAHEVVTRQACDLIWEVDPEHVRFFNRDYKARPPREWEFIDPTPA